MIQYDEDGNVQLMMLDQDHQMDEDQVAQQVEGQVHQIVDEVLQVEVLRVVLVEEIMDYIVTETSLLSNMIMHQIKMMATQQQQDIR